MHCISTENDGANAYFFTLNTDKWTMSGIKSEISIYDVPSDLTADPSDGRIYGTVYYEDYDTYDYGFIGFGEFSLSRHTFNIRKAPNAMSTHLPRDDKGKATMFGTRTGWIEPTTLEWNTYSEVYATPTIRQATTPWPMMRFQECFMPSSPKRRCLPQKVFPHISGQDRPCVVRIYHHI